jgi:hypothetical protein
VRRGMAMRLALDRFEFRAAPWQWLKSFDAR